LQDVALLGDFNIQDTMFYFGRIFGMSTSEIKERSKFLAELLELPPHDRFIEKLR
jgi:ABC-type Na+ transport system ATPase subunit NatA